MPIATGSPDWVDLGLARTTLRGSTQRAWAGIECDKCTPHYDSCNIFNPSGDENRTLQYCDTSLDPGDEDLELTCNLTASTGNDFLINLLSDNTDITEVRARLRVNTTNGSATADILKPVPYWTTQSDQPWMRARNLVSPFLLKTSLWDGTIDQRHPTEAATRAPGPAGAPFSSPAVQTTDVPCPVVDVSLFGPISPWADAQKENGTGAAGPRCVVWRFPHGQAACPKSDSQPPAHVMMVNESSYDWASWHTSCGEVVGAFQPEVVFACRIDGRRNTTGLHDKDCFLWLSTDDKMSKGLGVSTTCYTSRCKSTNGTAPPRPAPAPAPRPSGPPTWVTNLGWYSLIFGVPLIIVLACGGLYVAGTRRLKEAGRGGTGAPGGAANLGEYGHRDDGDVQFNGHGARSVRSKGASKQHRSSGSSATTVPLLAAGDRGRDVEEGERKASGDATITSRASTGISSSSMALAAAPAASGAPAPADIAAAPSVVLQGMALQIGDRAVLDDVSGSCGTGLCAIIGPSGCGKTSLIDMIAGRKTVYSSMAGNVLVDGTPLTSQQRRSYFGYVLQDDVLLGTMTVEETLSFTAQLRAHHLTPEQRFGRVNSVIAALGLTRVRQEYIGGALTGKRGLSGGERRRVSIAKELIGEAPVLLLDEPTSGLDSAAAKDVIEAMRTVVSLNTNAGDRSGIRPRPCIFSIHQASGALFATFDKVLLLTPRGRLAYFGPAHKQTLLGHFAALGHRWRQDDADDNGMGSPSEWLLDLVTGQVRGVTADAVDREICDAFASSDVGRSEAAEAVAVSATALAASTGFSANGSSDASAAGTVAPLMLATPPPPPLSAQVYHVGLRCVMNVVRNPLLLGGNLLAALALSLVVGWLFWQVRPAFV